MKPCPFCGEKPALIRQRMADDEHTDLYSIDCLNSDCYVDVCTYLYTDVQEAISNWNDRV